MSRKFLFLVCILLISAIGFGTVSGQDEYKMYIRVAHFGASAEAVDVYVDGVLAEASVSPYAASTYVEFTGEMVAVAVVPAGGAVDSPIAEATFSPEMMEDSDCYYTAVLSGMDELVLLPRDGMVVENAAAGDEFGTANVGNITISGAYARATPMGMSMGMGSGSMEATPSGHMGMSMGTGEVSAAYMVISNSGDTADKLVSASTEVSEITQIHESKVENGMAMMNEIDGLEIPAGGSVELMPGGYHVMMMDVMQPLAPGATITLTLKFESGTEVTVVAPVKMPQ